MSNVPPRTNSLAFAKSDCHTCKSKQRKCDRQRPICKTCQDAGDKCAGFQTRLVWEGSDLPSRRGDDSRRRHKAPARAEASDGAKTSGTDGGVIKRSLPSRKAEREFAFVSSWPPRPRKKHTRKNSVTSKENRPPPSNTVTATTEDVAPNVNQRVSPHAAFKQKEAVHPNADKVAFARPTMMDPTQVIFPEDGTYAVWSVDGAREEVPILTSSYIADRWAVDEESHASFAQPWPESVEAGYFQNPMALSKVHHQIPFVMSQRFMTSIPPHVQYASIQDQYSVLLDRYDQEFCKYPITIDLDTNPFRYRRETSRGSKHLFHAIIALACHYRKDYRRDKPPPLEFYEHKNQSVVLYKEALQGSQIQHQSLPALDTLLALWCIDTTEAALNDWRTHLSNAYALLELAGGVNTWSLSFRTQTQVAMFLWWDAVVSLTSRRAPTMPYSYFEAVLQWESSPFWTFFDLVGIPRELLVPLMQFAHLVGQMNSKNMSQKTLRKIVTEIESNLKGHHSLQEDLESDDTDEDKLQEARDRFHCCEAIRHSLQIYAIRVFPDQNIPVARRSARLKYLSRLSLDHVISIRTSSDTLKQLLLPIFFAGAETDDQRHKDFIRGYCERWYGVFGYDMFPTTAEILEEVWASQLMVHQELWWGEVIDMRRHACQEGDYDFCFG
ncbi:hypothetical protein PV08_10420 [Exophiala spinifera]|uniref:Zn(2)-C6 fungal-type domain-containing protein n=1 Tax=Exophiala spinifera TaxID=91928 RepID=A0A0D2AXG1_9EURO|nr:uncharacterized protein PV08_10420 [Exophiala spinifera]KIW11120.1 hypothetical protein PV08_10420 [Exophiala spinifera]